MSLGGLVESPRTSGLTMISGATAAGHPALPLMAPPPPPVRPRGNSGTHAVLGRGQGGAAHYAFHGNLSRSANPAPMDRSTEPDTETVETADAGPLPGFPPKFGGSASSLERRMLGGDISEGPSESSTNIEDTEDDDFMATIPHLERFYEQLAAKAKLPERNGTSTQSWVLSLARSYRRLSREKRRRGGFRTLLQPSAEGGLNAGFSAASGSQSLAGGLRRPVEKCFSSSNTDDSGYEGGYETDADESELSEWESGSASQRLVRHKRKLDALVQLTMKLRVSEGQQMQEEDEEPQVDGLRPPFPPCKRSMLGTQPVGRRESLPHATPPRARNSDATRAAGLLTGQGALQNASAASSAMGVMEVG